MSEFREVFIGTSWKMNKTLAEAKQFAAGLANTCHELDPRIQRFVVPPFTSTREVSSLLEPTDVMVGAQNMHWSDDGAWTGEISPIMLKDCGLDLVELGHSERREHFGETDEHVGLKVEAAVRHGLTPLICIGETLTQRENGEALAVLTKQVHGGLDLLSVNQRSSPIWIAYEPVWAIGENGIPATSEYADARHAEIIGIAAEVVGRELPCLYGGSVNPDNCEELIGCPHINGLFIGRSAWNVDGYLDILGRCSAALKSQEKS